ncbi:hypothetical protein [Bradyrhizobium sp. DASA03007]|uniref:hypothetical protein n=1 Tax=unclassified Bradyrhizobium TaxID=2631580 RepID=UPI003F70C0A8
MDSLPEPQRTEIAAPLEDEIGTGNLIASDRDYEDDRNSAILETYLDLSFRCSTSIQRHSRSDIHSWPKSPTRPNKLRGK